ncbi:RluA family pseudouridine synthase [Candidatus Nitrosacidococcus sp. I8]|uniref:RluA family pseudouridine synthase n=1 Tax=Candidatus Nitrosacidococcus sp. I8 TaxID=2942908 RepID=UPI002226AA13|nr:RluA family pseudouridine synthase [Candidatus Nitrosacidococcus sp. I8]CAH9019289.1 Ribosomal large subunit pseudouridine synthase C [Candidatus Nitrosacidococcus sp. I8]
MPSVRILEIKEEQKNQRIDNFLITYLKGVPKSRIYRSLRKGEVRVNKSRVESHYRLQYKDQVRIPPLRVPTPDQKLTISHQLSSRIHDSLLHEDDKLIVLNKPAGIPVHSGSNIAYGIIEILRYLRPNAPFLELAHRLDRETSGCLMIAKTRDMLLTLQNMQKNGLIHKSYLALVKGHWQRKNQHINLPLSKNILQSGERIVKVDLGGKSASSHFYPKKYYNKATLVEIALETGRTHQIRVHSSYLGNPIAGDQKYGDPIFNKELKILGLHRLFLHARQVVFNFPRKKKPIEIVAPTPTELDNVLKLWHDET